MICKCGGQMSMSAQTGGVTWWRCIKCGQFESTRPGQPVPQAPAPAPAATPPPVAARARGGARKRAEPAATAPASSPVAAPAEPVASPEIDGCGVCSSPDVTYVLSTDITGSLIRAGFCSIECLATKLGLVRSTAPRAPVTVLPGESRQTGT